MMSNVIFISGIDTDIGKSVATGYYANQLQQQGYTVITQKMVQTGQKGISHDIQLHRQIQGISLTEDDLKGVTCPYIFDYPCSPHLAAKLAQTVIDPTVITHATQQLCQRYDYVLLEGAGGLFVPYNEEETILDYIVQQGYPLILVTSGRLGSINHTLQSLKLCQVYQIPLIGVIYNQYPQVDCVIEQETVQFLQRYIARYMPNVFFEIMPEMTMLDC